MYAPGSRIGPLDADERREVMKQSVVAGVYDTAIDRESAFERLAARADQANAAEPTARQGTSAPTSVGAERNPITDLIFGSVGPRGGKRDGLIDMFAKSAVRSAGSSLSRTILRGVLGSLKR